MKKSDFDITVHYEVEGDLWLEGKAARVGKGYCAHDQGSVIPYVKSLKDILTGIIQAETGDFQPHTVKILWLVIEVKYQQNLPSFAKIGRTKIFSFEPDPTRYPDYFAEV